MLIIFIADRSTCNLDLALGLEADHCLVTDAAGHVNCLVCATAERRSGGAGRVRWASADEEELGLMRTTRGQG